MRQGTRSKRPRARSVGHLITSAFRQLRQGVPLAQLCKLEQVAVLHGLSLLRAAQA